MQSYRDLQLICVQNSHLAGRPRCNSKRSVLEEWIKANNLLPKKGEKKSAVADFFSLFPGEDPADPDVSFSLQDDTDYPGLKLDYYPAFFASDETERIIKHLSGLTFVPKRQFNRYAKPAHVTSSKVFYAWFSDFPDAIHNFSKAHLNGFDPQEFTTELETIRTRILEATGVYYNSLLVNFYPDGSSALSAHSDDSKWLGEEFDVPSLSFGAERDIIFRGKEKTAASGQKVKLRMANGSLTIMRGASTQRLWTHEIPARAGKSWRFNLTFRNVKKELISKNPRIQDAKEMQIARDEAIQPQDLISV